MTDKNTPAFPSTNPHGQEEGMTLRQYAAIHLKIPNSGTVWLDVMIEDANKLDRRKGIEMNTTHINEPIEQSAKQVAIQLGGEVSLRDYFAAKAMHAALMTAKPGKNDGMDEIVTAAAEAAYKAADAMLKAMKA